MCFRWMYALVLATTVVWSTHGKDPQAELEQTKHMLRQLMDVTQTLTKENQELKQKNRELKQQATVRENELTEILESLHSSNAVTSDALAQ